MSQSTVITGSLLAAFIFWLAINGRLQSYTAVLWGNTTQPTPTGTPVIGVKNDSGGSSGGGGGIGLPGPSTGGSGLGLNDFLDSLNLSDPIDAASALADAL